MHVILRKLLQWHLRSHNVDFAVSLPSCGHKNGLFFSSNKHNCWSVKMFSHLPFSLGHVTKFLINQYPSKLYSLLRLAAPDGTAYAARVHHFTFVASVGTAHLDKHAHLATYHSKLSHSSLVFQLVFLQQPPVSMLL